MSPFAEWAAREAELDVLLRVDPRQRDRLQVLAALATYARGIVRDALLHATAISHADVERALQWLLRPVFVCGHHRTGTTLLQELLDGHPQLIVLPTEVTYFASSPAMATENSQPGALEAFAAEWVARFVDPNGKQHFHLGRASPFHNPAWSFVCLLSGWQSALRAHPSVPGPLAGLLALAAAYHDVALPTTDPRCWVEKTPLNERHATRLAAIPGARFIQLVREPAATLRSQLADLRGAGVVDVDSAEQSWRIGRSLRLARRNRAALADRYHVTRYEDLVGTPQAEMERVRLFLELDAHESLSRPTVLGSAVPSNSSFEPGGAGSIHAARQAAALDPLVGERLARLTHGIAAEFGYDSAAPRGPLSRVRRGGEFLRVALRIARRRLRAG